MNNSLSMPQFRDCLTKKLQSKPWITKGILTSMLKPEYTENIAEPKIKTQKEELYKSFKFHRNTLNKLTRLSKTNHL